MAADGAHTGGLARQMSRVLDGVTGRQSALGWVMAKTDCGTPLLSAAIPGAERAAFIRRAFRLEWFTVAWMTIEAIVAIASGVAAHRCRGAERLIGGVHPLRYDFAESFLNGRERLTSLIFNTEPDWRRFLIANQWLRRAAIAVAA
jgi:hypothetical protein